MSDLPGTADGCIRHATARTNWRRWLRPATAAALVLACCGPAAAQLPPDRCVASHPATAALVRSVVHADGSSLSPAQLADPAFETQAVSLPDRLPLQLRNEQVHVRYEIDVSACADAPAAALWMFRVGAPYSIHALGSPLQLLSANQRARTGAALPPAVDGEDAETAVYNGRIPALFALQPGMRTVSVELQTLPYMPFGLVGASVGPTNQLLPLHTDVVQDLVGYADAASGLVLVLGLMALLLWLPRRRDMNQLWLAVACGLWGIRGLVYYNNTVPGRPILYEQLNAVSALLAAAMLAAAVLHMLRTDRRRHMAVLAAVTLVILVTFVVAEALGSHALVPRSLAQIGGTAMMCWLGVEIWRRRHAMPLRHFAGLTACLVIVLGTVAHDLLVVAGTLPPTSNAYVFWGFLIALIGFALMSGEYVVLTLSRAERTNEELELRVAAKSAELEQSYVQLRNTEVAGARETARVQEREHLLREMHDGIGAQLMTALRGVERGALSREQLAQSLQDGLDELRLLMDSTDMNHYLPGALASWRNRWDARLSAAGVQLEWRIDDSLDQVSLSSESALQVMRILQEATTNVVKHSQATHLRLEAGMRSTVSGRRRLHIDVTDDGNGLPPEAVRAGARGLKNMQYRAGLIGARLDITNRPAPERGCVVRLAVPLDATPITWGQPG
ncbi:MAG: 7TM diverse intracellular signaling domain-containing protein [Polaromonas sp.]|nr:7TM diverse intracellular signaling domain-containing protein [Polaromonas sp.]